MFRPVTTRAADVASSAQEANESSCPTLDNESWRRIIEKMGPAEWRCLRTTCKNLQALTSEPRHWTPLVDALFWPVHRANPAEHPRDTWLRATASQRLPAKKIILEADEWCVNAVAVDKGVAATAGIESVKLWSTIDGHLLHNLRGQKKGVQSLALFEGIVAAGEYDGTVRLWRAADGQPLYTLDAHYSVVRAVALSREVVATGSNDRTAKLWSLTDGRLLHTLSGHEKRIFSIATDGKIVATGSGDGTAKIWSVREGLLLRTFDNRASVHCVALARDTLITGSRESPIKVWSLANGIVLRSFGPAGIDAFGFSGDTVLYAPYHDDYPLAPRMEALKGRIKHQLDERAGISGVVAIAGDVAVVGPANNGKAHLWKFCTSP